MNQKLKVMRKYPFFSVLGLLFLVGCNAEFEERYTPVKSAFGEINQVVVVAEDELYQSAVGDTFQYYLSSPELILPQPEPIFDLVHFNGGQLDAEPLRRQFMTYILLGTTQQPLSPTARYIREAIGGEKFDAVANGEKPFSTVVGRNQWADGQLLFFMLGRNDDALIQNVQTNYPSIVGRIRDRELTRIEATTYAVNGTNRELQERVRDAMGIDMKIPDGYVEALHGEEERVMWLRRETNQASYNILLKRYPYRSAEQFDRDTLIRLQNKLGRRYISTTIPNTYQRINDVDLPLFTKTLQVNGAYALEARGIWDIVNDFMGGPFLTYLILDEKNKEIVLAEGFIHAPGEKKRDLQQSMEVVLNTIRL